ncbi:Rpn family recombination-promoting nuclease/putative transposase [Anaerovorax odorimutans]|uniref:Rpn family recombination-promoting nuclease/putative transposase n=1 Tax=Anaerovorax odorimutans TaxID=109327 RepID=A0ABT1RK73_9FIRM|nr:Rpn family recombination-promoting nuclease/putative transposase [Anaerovorax odorimutans]
MKNDVIFKAVYGRENEECKQALIAVLNLILDRKEDPIRKIDYKNSFNLRKIASQKESVLDIKGETMQGELLDLEIQLLYDEDFIPRNIYYHGGMITEALESGQKYGMMKKTISIFIVDFSLFEWTRRYHCQFGIEEIQEHFSLTDLMEMHYLELPKVNPDRRPVSQLTELERYLEYLRYAGDPQQAAYLSELKAQGGKEIQMTERLLKKATADEIIREEALARDKFLLQQACRERQWARREKECIEKETQLAGKETQLAGKETQLAGKENQLTDKETQLAGKENQLTDKETQLTEKENQLAGKEMELTDKETQLVDKESQLADKETQLANRERQLSEAKEKVERDLVRKMRASGMSKEQIAEMIKLDQAVVEGYLRD